PDGHYIRAHVEGCSG
ncbi:hypothetical protein A2U01_0117251, partial [Trifolium medium]|nr:hypothetical protein [Trifolium medium]